jgi:hypothetical protein
MYLAEPQLTANDTEVGDEEWLTGVAYLPQEAGTVSITELVHHSFLGEETGGAKWPSPELSVRLVFISRSAFSECGCQADVVKTNDFSQACMYCVCFVLQDYIYLSYALPLRHLKAVSGALYHAR